ncbi:winged helix DNA-binding protein [Candidatus Woesearchaeota archaeon]|jgi:predicted nucleotidyltransferase|nr:winged helix DNA-binding protein [Candidatus Woesearchaeota archaeon]MBT5740655.1 winged helix DNA-binding protein [Candidatus Woesearchaeota archaeon]MBT6402505.1 winged helix DNA-binding protein [Candidatus Woesearchaeota archaeon]
MERYKVRFTRLQQEIFRLFCVRTGKKLSQRKVAEYLLVSPTAIANSIPELEKAGLIKRNKSSEMNLNLVELNRDDQRTIQLKKVENLKRLYESGLVNKLIEQYPGCTIVLFGSYAKGEDLFNSDIDFAVIGTKKKSSISKGLEKELRINTYQSWSKISKELKESICNGIVLAGGIEL